MNYTKIREFYSQMHNDESCMIFHHLLAYFFDYKTERIWNMLLEQYSDSLIVVSSSIYEEEISRTPVKMDIEGTELNALKGSKAIIKRCKPRLAICIYHNPEDIFEIPTCLLELNPEYKFYIRQHAISHNETVLYAV